MAVPFCEAMMDGDTLSDIYSEAFIRLRARELNVDCETYRSKMQAYDALQDGAYSTLCLWFGKDTFCQLNLLIEGIYILKKKRQYKENHDTGTQSNSGE